MVLDCSAVTADGYVEVGAFLGESHSHLSMSVIQGDAWFDGNTSDFTFSPDGVEGSLTLPNVLDPSVSGAGTLSAQFTVVDRIRTRFPNDDGWFMRIEYIVTVEGTLTFEAPGISLELPLDDCYTDIRDGMSKS